MKNAVIVVRILLGLLFIFGSITYFLNLYPQAELTGNVKIFMDGLYASGYVMTLVKITELVCGIAFVANRFVPLASIVIAPIIVNIFLLHLFVDASGLPAGIFLVLANSFLAYSNWEKYQPILAAN